MAMPTGFCVGCCAVPLSRSISQASLEVLRGARREICAGAIALGYEELGGEVRYHGKPHAEIYATCLAMIEMPAHARIAAIGDSLRTDIAGARAAGIDGLFITGGLQGQALGRCRGQRGCGAPGSALRRHR